MPVLPTSTLTHVLATPTPTVGGGSRMGIWKGSTPPPPSNLAECFPLAAQTLFQRPFPHTFNENFSYREENFHKQKLTNSFTLLSDPASYPPSRHRIVSLISTYNPSNKLLINTPNGWGKNPPIVIQADIYNSVYHEL
jgi:hypothetical protein